jgi:hypothetical protein
MTPFVAMLIQELGGVEANLPSGTASTSQPLCRLGLAEPRNDQSPGFTEAPGTVPLGVGYFFSRLSTNARTPSGGLSYLVGRSLSVGPTAARRVSPALS